MGSVAGLQSQTGATVVLGVDPSSRKIAVMMQDGVQWSAHTMSVPPKVKERSLVLASLLEQLELFYREAGTDWRNRDAWLYVERPLVGRGGVNATVVQAQVSGLVLAHAIHSGASGAYAVHPGTWKKDVVGHGNAGKDGVREWLTEHHPVLAELAGDDQDLVDAACIALYGRQVVTRARSLESTIRVDT